MKFVKHLFSVENKNNHKVWTICGLKFKFRNQKFSSMPNESSMLPENVMSSETRVLHALAQNCLYDAFWEKMHAELFFEYYDRPDFEEKYKALIKGLDFEDIKTINSIIRRQQLIRNENTEPLDIFSLKEKWGISQVYSEFYNQITKISDNIFAWGKYLLPINHFESSIFYYKHGLEEIKNINQLKNKDIIDAGGFIGDSALILSELTDKKVYSFEALPEHLELHNKTILLNDIENVVSVNYALSDKKCTVSFNVCGTSTSMKEVRHMPVQNIIEVNAITLDEYVKENNLQVGLIKTDVEGAEQELLKGAINTIKTQKPVLLISLYHNPSDFFEIKPLIESWNLGYKFKIFRPNDRLIYIETLLIAEVD